MTQAQLKFLTFADYLAHTDRLDGRYEWIEGVLVELPPESEANDFIANALFLLFVQAGIAPRLVRIHTCELQVPILQVGDAGNRFPDLVILRKAHLQLTQKRLTITLEMPPPRLVAEVVSPGNENRTRDYHQKRAQYEAVGIEEYWIIDPEEQVISVLSLHSGRYTVIGQLRGEDQISSPTFPNLSFTAAQILDVYNWEHPTLEKS
jgi:Uma2 family endonuclease